MSAAASALSEMKRSALIELTIMWAQAGERPGLREDIESAIAFTLSIRLGDLALVKETALVVDLLHFAGPDRALFEKRLASALDRLRLARILICSEQESVPPADIPPPPRAGE